MFDANVLWHCEDESVWLDALNRYWDFVKPSHMALEREMDSLNADWVRRLDPQQWFEFLHDKYFRWKYTAPNRYASTTKHLRSYLRGDLLELYEIHDRMFSFPRSDIREGLTIVTSIRGLGVAGASGLLSLLFPRHFGTVDKFVVLALRRIADLPEKRQLDQMNEDGLRIPEGEILVGIMRRKSVQLNQLFRSDLWTPRKIDMVLWGCRECHMT